MRTRIAVAVAVVLLMPSLACDPSYSLSFTCEPDGGAECPPGPCPVVPEGTDACGDVPSVLGHPAIPIDMARPLGCIAWLPFGNPYYGNSQQTCSCSMFGGTTSATWLCGI